MSGEFSLFRFLDDSKVMSEDVVLRIAEELAAHVLAADAEVVLRTRLIQLENMSNDEMSAPERKAWDEESHRINDELKDDAMAQKFIELSQKQDRTKFERTQMKRIAKDFGKSL